jgi:hypothetical protein
MSWTTAVDDLRTKLSDGPTDKLRAFKRVFGDVNGTNERFKTLEFRRVTNFVTVDYSSNLGIYINGARVTPDYISMDDPETGFFAFDAAYIPTSGMVIEATYYLQWFLDAELESFLRIATNWLGLGDTYANIQPGLRPAALLYATADAFTKLASRFSETMSETYRLEDMPDAKRFEIIAAWKASAKESMDAAITARNDFYSRQGQNFAPLYGMAVGAVRGVGPSR